MSRKPTKSACYHEAGHAVIAAHLGALVGFVAVKPTTCRELTLPNSYRLRGLGISSVQQFANAKSIGRAVTKDDPVYPAIISEMIVAVAGTKVQAKAMKTSLVQIAISGGSGDFQAALGLLETIHESERADAWSEVSEKIRDAIRYRWRIIEAVTNKLMREGFVDGSVVNTMVAKHDAKIAEMRVQIDELIALSEKVSPDFWQD